MQVALERAVVFAGDVVRGKVYIQNATCEIEYNELYVEFLGEEYNWWQEMMAMNTAGGFDSDYGSSSMRDDYRVYSYSSEVIKARLPLVPPGPGRLGLGSHEFPFSFATPRGLPGSMSTQSMDGRGHVAYTVKARLAQSGLLAMGFKGAAELRVVQRAPRAPRPLAAAGDVELTSGCCCFKSSQGRVALRVAAPADVYCLGRVAAVPVVAEIQNSASAALTSAEVSLVRVVAFYTGQGRLGYVDTKPVAQSRLRLPPGGLAPGAALRFDGIALPLDANLDTNVDGRIVKVWHELRVEAHADGLLMSKPAIAPRVILCRDPAAAAAAAAPAGPAGKPFAVPPPTQLEGWSPTPVTAGEVLYAVDAATGAVRPVTNAELAQLAAAAAAADADALPSAPPAAALADGGGGGGGGASAGAGAAAAGFPAVSAAAAPLGGAGWDKAP